MQHSRQVAAAVDDRYGIQRKNGSGRIAVTLNAPGDLRRVVANVRDYRADAWMSKVIP
jgi:hypothetical protein